MKELTIFDYLNAIFNKTELKYDKKVAPAYLLSLWLSHDQSLLSIVNEVNRYHFLLRDEDIYNYYYSIIPKGRRFIRWTKKMEMPKGQKEHLEEISLTYNISKREAMLYKKLLTIIDKHDIIREKDKTREFFE
jgi:hypothetical protein